MEALDESEEAVELRLTHTVRDRLGRAYNRTTLFDRLRDMLQRWADYLDSLREGFVALNAVECMNRAVETADVI